MADFDRYAAEIMARSDQLAQCSEVAGEITRPYATPALRRARDLVERWMREAGMSTRVDQIGNVIGRYPAARETAGKTFLIGGHIDSVVDAGRYDGTLGVLTGIAVVQALRDQGRHLPFAIEVLAFADEEGNRFRTSFLGSSPVAGRWDPSWLDLADETGFTLREALIAEGGDPDALAGDALDRETLLGFLEVHIEQGPVLEGAGLPVAAVSSIAGSMRTSVDLVGMAGHAGTVPMSMRRDALAGAAEVVLAVEAVGQSTDGLVATVGRLDALPGASNVVPGRVGMTLDVRHAQAEALTGALSTIRERVEAIVARRGLELEWVMTPSFEPTTCDEALTSGLERAIAAEGIGATRLFSGAGHDAVTMAHACPVSMLFVRCKGGISHNPAESIKVSDVEVALRVVSRFLGDLA